MVFFDVLPYIFFITGIVVGSFLHVCAYRIPRGESILFPPSRCTCCGRRIKAVDLAPLLNYLWLKSRRRFCGGKISISHPLVELLTGLLFMTACLRFGLSIELIKALLLTSILVVISIIDMEYLIIPNKLIVIVLFLGAIFVIFTGEPAVLSALMGFGAAFLFLLALALASRGGIGGGDIKLMAAAGFVLGLRPSMTAMVVGFLVLSLFYGVYAIIQKLRGRDMPRAYPLAPFLSLGCLMVYFIH